MQENLIDSKKLYENIKITRLGISIIITWWQTMMW